MNNLNGNNGGQSTQGSPFTQGGQSTPGGFFNNGGQRGDQFPEAGSRMRSTEDQLKIAHAICMTLAYMVFISTAIMLARFFRGHWATKTPGGLKLWFHAHRVLNMIGIGLTIAGFVCIFVAEDWRWSGPKAFQSRELNETWGSVHSMVGLLSCVIVWAQPLNAVFRCHVGHRARFLFNWIHRFFGFGAWLLAAAAIMIACVHFESMFSSRAAALGLFIAFVTAFGIALILLQVLQFIGWYRGRQNELDDVNHRTRCLTSVLFFPYLVVSIGTAIAICVLIGLKPIRTS